MKRWRCFHCDEVLTTRQAARQHFGGTQDSEPLCVIKSAGEFALVEALRNAEDELKRYRAEDSDIIRALWSMISDHRQALQKAEEQGYERGLRDASTPKDCQS